MKKIIMKKTGKTIGLLLLVLTVVLGFSLTAYAQTSICSVCGASYENGFCKTENCAGMYQPATQTDIEGTAFYEIGNAGQLYWFAALVNGGEETVNAVLTADITINKDVLNSLSFSENGTVTENGTSFRAWTPIGNAYHCFRGVFDGNGHSISGLYFNDNTVSDVGLIGSSGSTLSGCTIRNITVKDSFFMGKSTVGAIAGRLVYSSVKNCSQSGLVIGMTGTVGGIVGYGDNVNIENCLNEGTVGLMTSRGPRGEQVGGVIGGLNEGELKECRNKGAVRGYAYVGGAVGMLRLATVVDFENEGEITGNSVGNSTGGVVGIIRYGGSVENCINKGAVSGGASVGGIVGAKEAGTVTDCQNTGAISGETSVGGVVGYNRDNNADYSIKNCTNGGAVKGNNSVGGVIGVHYSVARAENCFNTGDVTGNTKVGGVVGNNSGSLFRCCNLGNVTGISEVGGVAGENSNSIVSLSACFNKGNVSGESSVGGIAGKNSGVVSYNYNIGAVSGTSGVGAVVGTSLVGSEQRNYYLKTDSLNTQIGGIDGADRSSSAEGKSVEAFASGEVTYLLDFNFGQTLFGENADEYPVFLTENNRVYRAYVSCIKGKVYSNNADLSEKSLEHFDVDGDGTCDYCDAENAGNEGNTGNTGTDTPNQKPEPDGTSAMTVVIIVVCVVIVGGAVALILIKGKKKN